MAGGLGGAAWARKLGDQLIELGLITQAQFDHALSLQGASPQRIGSVLVSLGYLTEEQLVNALALKLGVRPWHLESTPPDPMATARVSGELCVTYQVLPVAVQGEVLVVAMRNPMDLEAIEVVRDATGMRIEPVVALDDRLLRKIDEVYGRRTDDRDVSALVDQALREFQPEDTSHVGFDLKEHANEGPVVALVNDILRSAIHAGASDVHIEPRNHRIDVRFRIDGDLVHSREVPGALLPMLATRLKIMADLDIVEFRMPQDGRISVNLDGREVDLRVSVLPNHHGQRFVLRILDKRRSLRKLDELDFEPSNLAKFRSLIRKPYGMLLVTGPTGSGKTTTLYAALAELRTGRNNIMTCEDPIEYEIDGINQSQVFEKVGLTFAAQLRAILRQDPDVILVGEIRDRETAETAIRAALTGHLVLSTLHCNDAPSAVPRMLDLGVDPFLLSTSLIGVTDQRLVRLLCNDCKQASAVTDADRLVLRECGVAGLDVAFRARGCGACHGTGYRGRAAIHSVLPVQGAVQSLVSERAALDGLRFAAEKNGYRPMTWEAGMLLASGRTSLEEIQRQVFFALEECAAGPFGLRAA